MRHGDTLARPTERGRRSGGRSMSSLARALARCGLLLPKRCQAERRQLARARRAACINPSAAHCPYDFPYDSLRRSYRFSCPRVASPRTLSCESEVEMLRRSSRLLVLAAALLAALLASSASVSATIAGEPAAVAPRLSGQEAQAEEATRPPWLLGEPNEEGIVPQGPRWFRNDGLEGQPGHGLASAGQARGRGWLSESSVGPAGPHAPPWFTGRFTGRSVGLSVGSDHGPKGPRWFRDGALLSGDGPAGPPWLSGATGDDGAVPRGPRWFRSLVITVD